MDFGFLNAWMLLGLAGIALPVLAHLISKRRFDVVHWGAMQFLELGQRSRRRIRLQDLLLLLLRMALLALVALALARPWGSGKFWGGWTDNPPRDYVMILDSSGSMAWQDPAAQPAGEGFPTPRQQAVQAIFDLLEQISPQDTVAIVEARSQPNRLVFPATTDRKRIRDALTKIAEPAGTSTLPEAIEEGLKILATLPNANLSQRIVVLTDDQSLAWQPRAEVAWGRVRELQKQTQRPPALQAIILGPQGKQRRNFSIGPIELSREMTVPEFPIKIRAMIRQAGGDGAARRQVSLHMDGQRIPGKMTEVDLLPNGEALVEFEHSFPAVGNFLASIVMEPDSLPQDNQAHAILTVTNSIPALLVDGDRQADPTRRETFYLQSLFAASGSQSPWVKASIIQPHDLQESSLRDQQVVFLCNVGTLTARQWEALRKFVHSGGGLVIAPGDQTQPLPFNSVDEKETQPFLPATLKQLVDESSIASETGVTIDSPSLKAAWLQRFRQENGVDLVRTRFQKWYRLEPVHAETKTPDPNENSPAGLRVTKTAEPEETRILARLSQGDPWLLERRYGLGTILQLATPLDADWSTLPAKNDFVPFVHELVFSLTSERERRNVGIGSPLLLPLKKGENSSEFVVSGPGIHEAPVEFFQRGQTAYARFSQTSTPGIYYVHRPGTPIELGERFVVDDDHRESDLMPLSETDWASMTADGPIRLVQSLEEVTVPAAGESPRAEFWGLLLILVLLLLITEAALTRRMVQGGHAAVDAVLEG